MRNICAVLITILLAFSVSGCIAQKGAEHNGVIIEKFEPDLKDVFSGEDFQMLLMVRNTGSSVARNVYPELYNVGGVQSETRISCVKKSCASPFNLYPPDQEIGTTGESRVCVWQCSAPPVERGISMTFNPVVRVYYAYETDTVKTINLVLRDEIRNVNLDKLELPPETATSTKGPIKITIVTSGPMRFAKKQSELIFPVEILVENVGHGVACISDCKTSQTNERNKIRLYLSSKSMKFYDCDLERGEAAVDLWEGKTSKLTCSAHVYVNPKSKIIQKSIEIKAEYGYYIDKTTSILVRGIQ
ncbi:MAG: hypothetical protein J7K72_01800 [Candidatus Aenigmarchaeota archaeon]|nr:hypothetical protein [Candidatus Aenigmarchaeota archaeon]